MNLVGDQSVMAVPPRRTLGRRLLALGGAGLLCVAAAACRRGGSERARYVPGEAPAVLGVATDSLRPAIAARLERGTPPGWVTPARWTQMRALYRTFADAPLWLEPGGVKDRAGALLSAIERAPEDGLSVEAYPVDSIRRIVEGSTRGDAPSAQALANADVMLTSAYVAYAADMLRGQVDPRSVAQAWHIGGQGQELDSALVHGIENASMDAALTAMAPQDRDYQLLKQGYARYQQLAAAGGWAVVSEGPALRPGAPSAPARLDALRARLQAEGYLADSGATSGNTAASPAPGDSAAPIPSGARRGAGVTPARWTVAPPVAPGHRYDATLAGAVAGFQKRHGFAPDSVLRPATVRALNVPAAYRAKQMAANLERHRWLPRALGMRYIAVNVPSFRLDAYDGGQQVLTMRVVVGDEFEDKATPAFSDSLETVVFRPYWNITDDIAAKETWPKIRADPGYMGANNMETFQEGGATRLRQRPGDRQLPGPGEVPVPELVQRLPARHARQVAVREGGSGGESRLHPPPAPGPARAARARLVRGLRPAADEPRAGQPCGPASVEGPGLHRVLHGVRRDGQLYFADDLYGRDDALERRLVGMADRARPRHETPRPRRRPARSAVRPARGDPPGNQGHRPARAPWWRDTSCDRSSPARRPGLRRRRSRDARRPADLALRTHDAEDLRRPPRPSRRRTAPVARPPGDPPGDGAAPPGNHCDSR
jgi:murein L,D-transpeptidase YcbB/YkuD